MPKLCCMGCEEGELLNPSTGDSSRQRSEGELLRGKEPHKNSEEPSFPPPQQQAAEVKGAGTQKKGRTAAPLSNISWFDLCSFSLLVSGRTKQGGPLIPEICTSSLSSPWSPSRVRHRAHCAHPAPQGKPCPRSGMRDRCHPPPLLAGKNFSNPLSTSISSFGHPTIQLSCSFHMTNIEKANI